MLDFPSTPQVDDTLTGPSGQVWKWDGVKWVAVAGGGGGQPSQGDVRFDSGDLQYFDGSAWQQVAVGGGWPVMGITDGSNAAPGEVGEVVAAYQSVTGAAGVYNVTGVSLTLPPGDWLVTLNFLAAQSFNTPYPAGVMGTIQQTITTQPSYVTGDWYYSMITVKAPVSAMGTTWGSATGAQAAGSIGPARINIKVSTVLTQGSNAQLVYPSGATYTTQSVVGVLVAQRVR